MILIYHNITIIIGLRFNNNIDKNHIFLLIYLKTNNTHKINIMNNIINYKLGLNKILT
jgi:hypothetical protein